MEMALLHEGATAIVLLSVLDLLRSGNLCQHFGGGKKSLLLGILGLFCKGDENRFISASFLLSHMQIETISQRP